MKSRSRRDLDGTPRAPTRRVDDAPRLPFDSVAILAEDGMRPLSLMELSAMTVTERVRLLGAGRLVFTSNGERVDPTLAIRAVYRHARSSSTTLRMVRPDFDRGSDR